MLGLIDLTGLKSGDVKVINQIYKSFEFLYESGICIYIFIIDS